MTLLVLYCRFQTSKQKDSLSGSRTFFHLDVCTSMNMPIHHMHTHITTPNVTDKLDLELLI
jgi:hypothetical protein